MTKARPAGEGTPFQPSEIAERIMGTKCAKQPACMRDRAPGREDKLCSYCGTMADYRATGDWSKLPNMGLCTPDRIGARCGIGWHDKACSLWTPPKPDAEKLSPKVRKHLEAMGADPRA